MLRPSLVIPLFVIALVNTFPARAANISARASLSSDTTELGEPVQLSLEVDNVRRKILPPQIEVDGLEIVFRSSADSQQVQFGTGGSSITSRLIYRYEVTPKRQGAFTIPALTIVADGETLQTKPVALKVQKGTATAKARSDGNEAKGANAFAEIDLKKKNIFLGEAVPIEVRFYIDQQRVRVGEVHNFELSGEGFTSRKGANPEQKSENRDGRTYHVVVFRSVLTPGKAGKLTIGPTEIPFVGQMRQEGRQRRRTTLDSIFGDDDFFNPFLGGGGFSQPQLYNAKASAVEINVRPLPVEGRPKDFSGAVGQFQFTAESPTTRIKAGEPVNMRLTIRGEGNFDRVQTPSLADKDGWQAYDASEKFDPSNEFKNSGTKTFEMPVVPHSPKSQTPQFIFSFFDPIAEKYVTQTSKPAPLVVEGQAPPAASTPVPASAQADAPAAGPQAEAAGARPNAGSPASLRYELGDARDFAPIHRRPVFWLATGAAAVVSLGFIGARLLRQDQQQKRRAALRREQEQLIGSLNATGSDPEFIDRAARVLQLATAARTGVDPACVDAAAAKSVLAREDSLAGEIDEIFERRGALVYAGGGGGGELSSGDRARMIAALEKVCRP